MCNYKNLNLSLDMLDQYIEKFIEETCWKLRSDETNNKNGQKIRKIKIGAKGQEDALIHLYLNGDGTTTISYKLGKNIDLSKKFAAYLYNTIDEDELKSVDLTLKGITEEDQKDLIELVNENEFDITTKCENDIEKSIVIRSKEYKDNLRVTYYKTTNKLRIQGKALFTYKNLTYILTDFLDLNGLQTILSKKELNTVEIVRQEVAKDYLYGKLPDAYDSLPNSVKDLLISGCCVKLAAPALPEYSMLLFPDFRGLEGVLKNILTDFEMFFDDGYDFGTFFEKKNYKYMLREEYRKNVKNSGMESILGKAYSFFNKYRHRLFHMDENPDTSLIIETLPKALNLSQDCYTIINKLYIAGSKS